jgi:hypothetical protein
METEYGWCQIGNHDHPLEGMTWTVESDHMGKFTVDHCLDHQF